MTENFTIRPYEAVDGMKMLASLPGGLKGYPDADKWCKEAERGGPAHSVFDNGKLVLCAGIIKEREGVGRAWALYPPDVGNYHIDPQIAKNQINEWMIEYDLWRVEATVRVDFPAGASYLRYLGFEKEGLMKMYEPDRTDSFLYAKTKKR